jgi:translation initiation factor 1
VPRLFAGTPWDRPPACDRCGRLESECACPPPVPEVKRIPPEQQTARLMTERRAKGKLVTVIAGLDPASNDLTELATRLKNACLASRRPVPIGLQSILSTFVNHPAPGCSRQL